MTTYEVACGGCGKEMLFEKAGPLQDPGTLPAFCSPECSAAWFRAQFVEADLIWEAPCGCVVAVIGPGLAMPWGICKPSLGISEEAILHRSKICEEAKEEYRRRN